MKKISYILIGLFLGLGFTAYAATTVSLGKNGTSEYLLYPTDSLSAYRFIATSTTASSTFGNGIDIANGCFAIGSVCLNTGNIAESGNLYWTSARATSSFNTLIGALDKGYFFSTTSADAWKLTKDFWATTSADYWYTLQNRASSTLYADIGTWANTQTMNITGLAGSATKLATARAINGVDFDGTAPITITAASSTLLGDTNTWSVTNQFAKLTFTDATGTRLSLFSGACDSSTQKPVVDAVGNWSCGTDTSGGGASQWATSTLFSNMIHTAGAHGVGIGTTTPIGVLSLASSSAVTQWFNHTGASANKRLGYISWANGLFDFGTSSDAGATTSWLKMEEGTTTVSSPVLAVTNGGYTSRLIAGTGTSTLPGGINLQSGCLALNGTCLGTMALSGSIGQTQYYSGVNTAVGTSSLFIATSQNVGVGSTSPFAKLSVQGTAGLGTLFAVASSTNAQLFNIDHRGYVGIGSSTPWGVLSIIDPIGGSLFNPGVITATSTVDLPFFGWTASTSAAAGSEIRILAGNPSAYMSHGDSFDQLLINGRVNTGDWKQLECASDFNSKTAQITSDITGSVMSVALGKPCGDFSYIEDANGVADQVVTTGSGYVRLRPGATGATVVAGDGIGLAGTTAFLRHATNTPVMEATLRKGASQNASTSITMVGFSAATGVSANYATDAQDGCMFVASTTGNWKAVCRATTATIVDTGVASSSVTTGDGVFMKFRVELHNLNGTNYAVFRILQSKTASWQTVATINTNIPSGISLNPIVSIGKVSAGLSPELHVGRIRVWYNDPLWY